MRLPRLIALLVLGLAFAGCTHSSGSTGDGGQPNAAATTKRPQLAPGEPLITYSKVGGPPTGFVDDNLTVNEDRSFKISQYHKNPVTGTLTESELAALEKAFTDANFEKLDSDLSRSDTHIDELNYDIRYGNNSVTILHGAVSPAIRPVVDACDAFIASHGSG